MKIIIFCGGYGTRMWPASRKSYPKQFFPLIGGKSFFQITFERFRKQYEAEDIFVSTESKYKDYIKEQAPELPDENILLEPERRDNLAAIGLTTALMHKRFPGEVMFFSWCDHLIKNEREFLKCVKIAGEHAGTTGRPVSVDQEPTFPTVHNGWLKLGELEATVEGKKIYEIEKHIEKPNLQTAKKLFRSSNYLIHTGYGAWRSDTLMGYYETYAPETYDHLKKISDAYGTDSYESVLKHEYSLIEKISIDYGLFEKIPSHTRLTVRDDFGWQDVGTWQLMFESLTKGTDENLVEGKGKATFIEADGNLVITPEGKMISVIGLSNVAIIDTPTGLLVSSLEKTSRVKELFAILEKDNPDFVK
jgi:mannose-1-phosphate guanylyltransferase